MSKVSRGNIGFADLFIYKKKMLAIKTKPKSEGKSHTHCLDMLPGLMFDDLQFSWIAEVENLRSLRIIRGVMLA